VLFRELTLSVATDDLLQIFNETGDITDFSRLLPVLPLIWLFVCIEVFDKRGGCFSPVEWIKATDTYNDLGCSRQIVRFVHERNGCNCLESVFSELKATAQRTNMCWNCEEPKPVKQIKECSG
jgi:hypothetical protein